MTIFNLITLFGGLALFLYGMRLMGDGLKKGSSDAFKRAMEKVTNNPLVGFLLGLVVTAVIQSSTATIVLTSGLVGAGVMSLHQSIGVILGANVGTTITGQIIRLLDVNASETSLLNFFKPSTLAPLAAIIGILFLMAVKTRQSDTIGSIAMGFGILFTGLLSMTAAVSPLSESETFANMFYQLSGKPVLGFLLGAGVAFLLQSSSATIGILQAIATTGALTFSSVYAIIIGVNIDGHRLLHRLEGRCQAHGRDPYPLQHRRFDPRDRGADAAALVRCAQCPVGRGAFLRRHRECAHGVPSCFGHRAAAGVRPV